jgi:hypothetical protein
LQKIQEEQNNVETYVKLEIKTWPSSSKGIFNYLEKKLKHVIDKIIESYFYVRKDNDIIEKNKSQMIFNNNDGNILFKIRKSIKYKNKYEIICPIFKHMKKNYFNTTQLANAVWFIIRPETDFCKNENENYILNENDCLKLGNKIYEIIKLNIHPNENDIYNENNYEYNISQINKGKGSIFNIDIEYYQYSVTDDYNDKKIEPNEGESNNENVENNNSDIIKNKDEDEKEILEKKINYEKNNNDDNNKNKKKENNDNQLDKGNESTNNEKEKNKKNKNTNNNNNNRIDNNNNSIKEIDENGRCRICYISQSTKDNPKLRICSCKDYIHFECLKQYIKTKIEVNENPKFTVQTYICSKFNCEVCLSPYPLRFRIKEFNKIYDLIDFNLAPELDYLVLESLDYMKDEKNYKLIHVVQLIDEKISIGRNTTNDIIDTDISVSRSHAVLNYNKEKGYITIENRSQKFGTLVLIKGKIPIKEKKIGFQVGKSFVTACTIKGGGE